MSDQVVTTSHSSGSASTVPLTAPRVTTRTTPPVSSTRPRTAVTTAPARVVPASPYSQYTSPYQYQSPTTLAPTTPAPTTTLVGIGGHLPAGPVTLPLRTTSSNGHVSPVFAWLSGAGFAIALIMVCFRLYMTRSGAKDRAPLV